jgi:hypothetical protein
MLRHITVYYTPIKIQKATLEGLCRVYENPTRLDYIRVHFMEQQLRAPKAAN